MNAADLVQEHIKLDDFITAETKRFGEHLAPHKKRMEEIRNLLLGLLNEQKQNSASTDFGTYYISTLMTPKVTNREAYLDWVNEHWDEVGSEILQISAPQKERLRQWLDENNQQNPPGVEISYFNRLNIRRS